MKNLVVENWQDHIEIDLEGRDIVAEMADWLDDDGNLVLIDEEGDHRAEFVRQWWGLMNEEFGSLYLKNN